VTSMLKDLVWLIPFVYFFSRSSIGNRTNADSWPKWMEKLGDRDIPSIISSDWFFWIAWSSRRALPIITALTITSLWSYISGGKAVEWLSGPDWLAISALAYGCFTAYAPFAKKPRRNPLDKWMGTTYGLLFVVSGLMIVILVSVFHYAHIHGASHTTLGDISNWAASSELSSSLGIAGGLIGFGIALLGLTEILPNWRTGVNVIDNSAELEELKLKNQELLVDNKELRRKLRSNNRNHHQGRPTKK
jgi:hypothetical protein